MHSSKHIDCVEPIGRLPLVVIGDRSMLFCGKANLHVTALPFNMDRPLTIIIKDVSLSKYRHGMAIESHVKISAQ